MHRLQLDPTLRRLRAERMPEAGRAVLLRAPLILLNLLLCLLLTLLLSQEPCQGSWQDAWQSESGTSPTDICFEFRSANFFQKSTFAAFYIPCAPLWAGLFLVSTRTSTHCVKKYRNCSFASAQFSCSLLPMRTTSLVGNVVLKSVGDLAKQWQVSESVVVRECRDLLLLPADAALARMCEASPVPTRARKGGNRG